MTKLIALSGKLSAVVLWLLKTAIPRGFFNALRHPR